MGGGGGGGGGALVRYHYARGLGSSHGRELVRVALLARPYYFASPGSGKSSKRAIVVKMYTKWLYFFFFFFFC